MKNKNLILFLFLLILSVIVFIMPLLFKGESITPKSQMAKFISSERYINADELADKLINKDPSIVLVDLRSATEFKQYHIPSAINIPFDSLLIDKNMEFFNQDKISIVLYSNDNLLADQAWFLVNSLGHQNLIVLKNGLKGFYNTILNPTMPLENSNQVDFDQYNFRKAAGIFFGVPYNTFPEKEAVKIAEKPILKKVEPVKKVKIEIEEGGC